MRAPSVFPIRLVLRPPQRCDEEALSFCRVTSPPHDCATIRPIMKSNVIDQPASAGEDHLGMSAYADALGEFLKQAQAPTFAPLLPHRVRKDA